MDIIDILSLKGRQIKFGATVTMIDEETEEKSTFQIVGEYEADPAEGKISVTSPIARALIGKSVDDSVEVITPRGQKDYEILKVDFK